MTPQERCAPRFARSRSTFLPAFLFLRGPERAALQRVYAFLRSVDEAVDDLPLDEARPRVLKLKVELTRALAGEATHPVAVRLGEVVAAYGLDTGLLCSVVAALEQDLVPARIATLAELHVYVNAVAGDLGVLLLPLFGVRARGAERAYGHALGAALQIINIARDVGEDAQRGRAYVPAALLEAHGATTSDLLAMRDTPRVRAALGAFRRLARTELARARALLPRASRRKLCVPEIMADLYESQLDALDARSGSPYSAPRVRRRDALVIAAWRYAVSHLGQLSFPSRSPARAERFGL